MELVETQVLTEDEFWLLGRLASLWFFLFFPSFLVSVVVTNFIVIA